MPSGSRNAAFYCARKGTLLESVPLGVTTWTVPVVAPVGTVVVISELETTSKTAAVPLKLTLVAPVRFVPRILTAAPTLPKVGSVSTNGPKPTDRLKTVPKLLGWGRGAGRGRGHHFRRSAAAHRTHGAQAGIPEGRRPRDRQPRAQFR